MDRFLASWRAPAVVVALVAIILLPMLAIDFVNDDLVVMSFAFTDNHPDLMTLLTKNGVINHYYRPLIDLTFAIDYWIWGWNAAGVRLTNLLLHLANVVIVYRLVQRLAYANGVAFLVALLFGLLPIHETLILYIPGRTDMVCSIFYLSSIIAYLTWLEHRRRVSYIASLLLCVLALLSKEMAISLPILLLAVSWHFEYVRNNQFRFLTAIKSITPHVLVIAAVVMARILFLDNNVFVDSNDHGNAGIIKIIYNFAVYIGIMTVPAEHYQLQKLQMEFPVVFLGTAIVCLAASGVILWRFRRRIIPLIFPAVWLLITLLPVSRMMMRWRLYIPSVGFAMALGWLLWLLAQRRRRLSIAITTAICIGYSAFLLNSEFNWISAANLANQLVDQLRQDIAVDGRNDTLFFVSNLAKIRTTPVFHLGFQKTIQHALNNDSLTVISWARVVADEYPADVHYSFDSSNGTHRLELIDNGYFYIPGTEFREEQTDGSKGEGIDFDYARIEIVAENRQRKPVRVAITPQRQIDRHLYLFDGKKFVAIIK